MDELADIGWETLKGTELGRKLVRELRKSRLSKYDWKHGHHAGAKRVLKDILFRSQKSRCAYCRREIKDEIGHVEIDHILPKAEKGEKCKWKSNTIAHRRATEGYPAFAFHAYNLTLTCKRCNNFKGSYDCRADRGAFQGRLYILDENYYVWVHPYAHKYSEHVKFLKGYIYQCVDGSASGDAVIKTCKLDEVAAVENRSRELRVKHAKDYTKAILMLLSDIDNLGSEGIAASVSATFPRIALCEIENKVHEMLSGASAA